MNSRPCLNHRACLFDARLREPSADRVASSPSNIAGPNRARPGNDAVLPRTWTSVVLAGLLISSFIATGCGPNLALQGDGGTPDAEGWSPPIADIGVGGWRDSTTPWVPPPEPADCEGGGLTVIDILPTAAGIYLSWGWISYETTPDGPHWLVGRRSHLAFNAGDGWREFHAGLCPEYGLEPDRCIARLSGAFGSRLLVRVWSEFHQLAYLESSELVMWPDSLWDASDPFVVSDDLGYAVWTGADSKVLRFVGGDWLPIPEVLPYDLPYSLLTAIWADAENLFLAGERGTVLSLEPTGWRNHVLPTTADMTALWGFGGEDVWAADRDAMLFHWDGSSWTRVEWPNEAASAGEACAEPNWITGMWGSGGVLFLHTGHEILRWNGVAFDVLGYWPGAPAPPWGCSGGIGILRVRGLSPNEVFFAASGLEDDEGVADGEYSCYSRPFVLFWDGTGFHWI